MRMVQTAGWICLLLAAGLPRLAAAQERPASGGSEAADSALPRGYQPPRDPSDIMTMEKPLLDPNTQKAFQKELRNYAPLLMNGKMNTEAERTTMRNGIRYRLNDMTLAANQKNIAFYRDRLLKDLYTAGKRLTKADQIRDFRKKVLEIVVEETTPLLENNLFVRIQAALLLGELNLMEENSELGTKREAFPPASKPLCATLVDPEQHEAVKVDAVLSLSRILRTGVPTPDQKRDIATALVTELARPKTHFWYQERLCEALGAVDITLDLNRQPFVYQALHSVLKDPERPLRVRAEAAWALGRHPLENSIDTKAICQDIVAVGLDLANAYNRQPKSPNWKRPATMLYLAFKQDGPNDLCADRKRAGGLLNHPPAASAAREAYDELLPVLRTLIVDAGQQVPPEQIQSLEKWLAGRNGKIGQNSR